MVSRDVMGVCGCTSGEHEYFFFMEGIFLARPVLESTFTHNIATETMAEGARSLHADQ